MEKNRYFLPAQALPLRRKGGFLLLNHEWGHSHRGGGRSTTEGSLLTIIK